MGDGHCFISYSNADGLDFATRLADELEGKHPFIDVWFEKREMSASGDDWDDQLASAISSCKCFLFVMSMDSTAKLSNCKEEWTWALKCKKPVICLLLDNKAEDQFRLSSRQKIDFTSNFEAGIAQLRLAIAHLDSPQGLLDQFKHRLADANRDLRRAGDEEKLRIKAELDELTEQIKRQEEIVRNPKAAQEQTRKNIEAGLERERQPEKPVAGKATTKFINPPPGVAPNYFQDRTTETKEIVRFLHDDSQRLLTVVGRGGVGKTAAVCRLLKHLENGTLPDDLEKTFGETKVDGIVYLSESGSHRVNFANIFSDLSKLLSTETATSLDAIYKNPQVSSSAKMGTLLDQFTTRKVVLLLDNVEPLINIETFGISDTELNESLCSFLQGAHSAVKIIITTRIAPRGLNLCEPGRQRVLSLDEGLDTPYAENILREMDSDGKVGLKNAPDQLLAHAREHTRGYPRALEALFAILSSDRYTTLEEILTTAENYLPDYVVQSLVGEAFSRLDGNAQKVMQGLAIYNRPVAPAAVDYLLAQHLPGIDSAPVLNRLVSMQFVRRESGRYYLHPVDREFALSRIPSEESEIGWDQKSLTLNAADYFAQARKPRTEWKKLDDLSAQLAEFDLRCAAGRYDTAASVLTEIDFDYLLFWGHYRLVIDLHLRVKDKIEDKVLYMGSLNGLGLAYRNIGKVKESITFHERGLETAHEIKNRDWEGIFLGNLGLAYAALGDAHKSIEFYKLRFAIARETGDRRGEGIALGNLGIAYAALGDIQKAIEFHKQALAIDREIGDLSGEGADLGNIANRYAELGDELKAIEFHEQALVIDRKIGDKSGEAIDCGNIADRWLLLGEARKAIDLFRQVQDIADNISFPIMQQYARSGEAQAHLLLNDLRNACATIEAALQYDVPENNHNATALHGIIALRQGERQTAQEAFTKSIAQADEILAKTRDYYSALDAKGLALSGLSVIGNWRLDGERDKLHAEAIETFKQARKIAPHAGVVKSVLRLFDELVKCDEEGMLKEVRKAVEGNA
jgi:tetratricopeptide (TPR) repeat protein